MMPLHTLQEGVDSGVVESGRGLIDLPDMIVLLNLIAVDGEGDDELDVVALAEVGELSHLLGVERTEDDVAVLGFGIAEYGRQVAVDGEVPGLHVG